MESMSDRNCSMRLSPLVALDMVISVVSSMLNTGSRLLRLLSIAESISFTLDIISLYASSATVSESFLGNIEY